MRERRMIIRTNPPGALAYVDDNEVGLTPVAISPIYYGNRKIRLVKDGYETLTLIQTVPPPWYEIPPLDFFAENLVPGKIRDVRTFDYQLRPQGMVPKEELLTRAEKLRHGTQPIDGRGHARLSGQSAVARTDLRSDRGPRWTAGWRPALLSASARPPSCAGSLSAMPGRAAAAASRPVRHRRVRRPADQPTGQRPHLRCHRHATPAGPANVGSQPYFPLPSGRVS